MLTRITLDWKDPSEFDPDNLPSLAASSDPSVLEAELVAWHEDTVATVWRHVYLNLGQIDTRYTAELSGGDSGYIWSEESPEFATVDDARDWAEEMLATILAPDPSEWGGPDNSTGEEYVPPVEDLPEEPF